MSLARMFDVVGAPCCAARLRTWVDRGWLRAHDVEPSVTLHGSVTRWGVNTSSPIDDLPARRAMTQELLAERGVASNAVRRAVERWIAEPTREAFVAWAGERTKLYFRAHRREARRALASVAGPWVPQGFVGPQTHTIGVDFEGGRPTGAKRYRWMTPTEAEAMGGRALEVTGIDPGELAAHLSESTTGERALHVQVHALDALVGSSFARAMGAEDDAARLEAWCRSVPLLTRVLGESLDPGRCTVYLGLPHTA